jgi:hypothetical protein|nr:MAG TPA: hypothetical protein [Caudoviricetes sp.]
MTYFDIQEAALQRWNDQPIRNKWLAWGCDWPLVVASLVGDKDPNNPPPHDRVEQVLTDHIKRFGASFTAPYTTIMQSVAYANVASEVTLSGHVRDVYSAALTVCRDAYIQAVLQDTVKDMVTAFFEEWAEWEGYP